MKTILKLLVGLFLLTNYTVYSQTINNPSLLKSELDTISAQKLPINSIASDQNGDWIILYGDIGFSFVSLPKKLTIKVDTLNKKQTLLKDIDFVGQSGWVLAAADNAFYSDSIPEKLLSGLKRINQHGQILNCIEIYKNKGIILYGKNSFYQQSLSSLLKKKLENLKYRNQFIKSIALTKDDGWIVLYAKKGFSYHNIPVALSIKIKELVQNGSALNNVFFLDDKWILIYDNYKYISNL